jgi:predicted unusual protein kinase regulating ubiquinone biosynthesis (AarF/ABC1/UbiB family)
VSWVDDDLVAQSDASRRVERILDDVIDALALEEQTPSTRTLLARAGDLARSSLFLWWEASLQAQELQARAQRHAGLTRAGAPRWLPRSLALVVLAADLYAGYSALRNRAKRSPQTIGPRDWDLQHQRGATRVLDTAISLGGTLIKAGQFASVRGDLLPAQYVTRLAALQDRVPPHSWTVIRRTLTAELGTSIDEVFEHVDHQPVGAASLAQVHAACLRGSGERVALKVQYPEIGGLVGTDLAAFNGILRVLCRLEPTLRLQPIVDHLRATLPLELDFEREACEMSELRRALSHRTDVVVPSIVPELCTPRLVTMEFVEGIKITDRTGLEQAGIDPRAVARLLNEVYAEQLLQLGRLHADPHPGNLLVQPGPRLVLLDHGLTLELSPTLVAAIGTMVRALVSGDFAALGDGLAQAGFPVTPSTDIVSLLQLAGVLLGAAGTRPGDVGRKLGEAIGDVPLELITVGRALSLLTGITQALDPTLDVLEIVSRYAPVG